jgi:glucose/arabinose dehydrogenase
MMGAADARAQDAPRYAIAEAFPLLAFNRPVDLQSPPDGTDRVFVVEQDGMIHVFPNRPDADVAEVFLDLRERVNRDGNEMGLLGLAFPADYGHSGVFYVNYTARKLLRRVTRVSRLTAGPYPNAADVASELTVIEIPQPWANHNGGQVAFGPDGMLYIAMGVGGGGGGDGAERGEGIAGWNGGWRGGLCGSGRCHRVTEEWRTHRGDGRQGSNGAGFVEE